MPPRYVCPHYTDIHGCTDMYFVQYPSIYHTLCEQLKCESLRQWYNLPLKIAFASQITRSQSTVQPSSATTCVIRTHYLMKCSYWVVSRGRSFSTIDWVHPNVVYPSCQGMISPVFGLTPVTLNLFPGISINTRGMMSALIDSLLLSSLFACHG